MRTLPLVFINLGGEMIYILDQRLRAHTASGDRSEKGRSSVWTPGWTETGDVLSALCPLRSVVAGRQEERYEPPPAAAPLLSPVSLPPS